MNIFKKEKIMRAFYIIAGNLVYALGLNLFFVGNNIAAGKFGGIATIINYLVSVPIGTIIILMNIPVFIYSIKVKGWKYNAVNLIGCAVYAVFVYTTSGLPLFTTNKLLAAIFGGVLYGLGIVFMMLSDCVAGGTDLVARLLLEKYKSSSIGKLMLAIDGLVVVASMIVFKEIEAGLYAILALTVCSFVADYILDNLKYKTACVIITEKDIKVITKTLHSNHISGATNLKGTGMFHGKEKNIIIAIVKPREACKVMEIINAADSRAFVFETRVNEVLGGSFRQ